MSKVVIRVLFALGCIICAPRLPVQAKTLTDQRFRSTLWDARCTHAGTPSNAKIAQDDYKAKTEQNRTYYPGLAVLIGACVALALALVAALECSSLAASASLTDGGKAKPGKA